MLYFGCRQCGEGGLLSKKRLLLPTNNHWARAFIDGGRGLHVETAQSALTVIFKLVLSGPTSITLIVLSTVTLQFQSLFVSISRGQFLELWQLMSWAQSGGHAVNLLPLGFQYLLDSSQDMAQNIIYSP